MKREEGKRTLFKQINRLNVVVFTFLSVLVFGSLAAVRPSPQFFPYVAQAHTDPAARPLIAAFVADGVLAHEPDEAFALWYPGTGPYPVSGWQVSDGRHIIQLPSLLLPGRTEIWCAREAQAFQRVHGFLPACEYAGDTLTQVPNAHGDPLRLPNHGASLLLLDKRGHVVDAVRYGDAAPIPFWKGPALQPVPRFSPHGQVFYRKRQEGAHMLVADSDRAEDWAQDPTDPREGLRPRYPGWALDAFWVPAVSTGMTQVEVAITPDTGSRLLAGWIREARSTVLLAVYSLRSPEVVQALIDRARAGVQVHVLVESRPVGGLEPLERALLHDLYQAGVQVHVWGPEPGTGFRRYRYLHAKYMVIDGRVLVLSTENFTTDAFPPNAWGTMSAGRRGVYLRLDARAAVARAQALFAHDADPRYPDVQAYDPADPLIGPPPTLPDPPFPSLGYRWVFTRPLQVREFMTVTLVSAPENALATRGGLLGVVDRVGAGDEVLVMGLYERLYFAGPGRTRVLNPRWEALFRAARRGARVRVLLDAYFDDPESAEGNHAVARQVNAWAQEAGWDVKVRLANPAGLGLHAKVWLVRSGSARWSFVGSMNGSATSLKANREMGLLLSSEAVHRFLSDLFWHDWTSSAH